MQPNENFPQQTLLDASFEISASLQKFQATYALIGGLAAGFRTLPRFTRDVDFLFSVPQLALPRLLEDMEARGCQFDMLATIREWNQHHMAVLNFHGVRIDLLKPVLPVYFHILDHATDEQWLGHTVRIASAEGLILLKLIAFRPQDQVDAENLVVANRDTLDLDWIRKEWETVAKPDDPRMQRLMEWVASR